MADVRKDLNCIVKGVQLSNVKTRYATRPVCRVTFFNGDTMDFNDRDGLLKLLSVYRKGGVDVSKDVVESVQLVEELRTDDIVLSDGEFDETSNTYICVLYTLKTGRKFRFFVDGRVNLDIINFYYDQWKKQQKSIVKETKNG